MAIRSYNPTSPGRRFQTVSTFEEITSTKPERSLLGTIKKTGGRNNNGRVTSRHRGGGHKRRYRMIDFKRMKDGVPAKVAANESCGPSAWWRRGQDLGWTPSGYAVGSTDEGLQNAAQ